MISAISFQRQLCMYGFGRIASGKEKGCRFHPFFRKGDRELCEGIGYSDPSDKPNSRLPIATTTTSTTKRTRRSPPHYIHHDVELQPKSSSDDPQRSETDGSERRQKKKKIRVEVKPEIRSRTLSSDRAGAPLPRPSRLDLPALSSSSAPTHLDDQRKTDVGVFEGMTFHLSSSPPSSRVDAVTEGNYSEKEQRSSASLVSEHSDDAEQPCWTASSISSSFVEHDDDVNESLRKAWELGYSFALSLPATDLDSTISSESLSNMVIESDLQKAKI